SFTPAFYPPGAPRSSQEALEAIVASDIGNAPGMMESAMTLKLKNRKILVADDEKLIRWSLHERLKREGYDVEKAADGPSTLRMPGQDDFDLLLLDFKLPDVDGLQVLKEVKGRNPNQVVILMTAYSSIENAVEAMRLGAYDYVNKPFNMDELILDVEKALE